MIKTIKTEIYPNNGQIEYFNKAFNVRNYVWNLCVERFINSEEKFNVWDFRKELNKLVKNNNKYSFMKEVNSMVREEAMNDFKRSLDLNKNHKEFGKPSLCDGSVSFRYYNKHENSILRPIDSNYFYLTTTRTQGRLSIKCAESLMFLNLDNIRLCTITISTKFNRYYISLTYEDIYDEEYNLHMYDRVGIDMGIKNPLTVTHVYNDNYISNMINYSNKISLIESNIDYYTSKLTKSDKGSSRYKKHKAYIDKLWEGLKNHRKEFIHYYTTYLCKTYKVINLETFSFNYTKNRKFSNSIRRTMQNISKYEFLRILTYKCEIYNNTLNIIPNNTPTTQTCSNCGNVLRDKEKLTLKDRLYKCDICNLELDRDVNASINILNHTF